MSDLTVTVSDTAPSVVGTITSPAGAPIDLTGCTVRFQMRLASEARLAVDAAAVVTNAAGGLVRYDWAAGDLGTAGDYVSRWRIYNASGGTVEHTDPANTITVAL